MKKWLKRFIGFLVVGFVLGLVGRGAVELYNRVYRGSPHYVVMPEGAAGVRPGSSVYYEGMVVGEVTEADPLVHTNTDTRQRANSAYLRKYHLLREIEGLTPRKRNPYRKALVRFLLREPSIPIGSSTYATGSAFYVTGQGYITLKNRGLTARAGTGPTFIPSGVKYPWLEQYVNMGLSVAPFLERVSGFHNRFENWYHGARATDRQETRQASGRSMIDAVPAYLDAAQSGTDALSGGLDTVGASLTNWNRLLTATVKEVPGGEGRSRDSSHPLSGGIHRVNNQLNSSTDGSIRSLQGVLEDVDRSVRSLERSVDGRSSNLFLNGILKE